MPCQRGNVSVIYEGGLTHVRKSQGIEGGRDERIVWGPVDVQTGRFGPKMGRQAGGGSVPGWYPDLGVGKGLLIHPPDEILTSEAYAVPLSYVRSV